MYKDKAKPLQGTHTSQSSHWNQSRLTPFNSANHKPGSPATWTGLASIDAQIPHNRSPITIPNQKGKEESHTTTGSSRKGNAGELGRKEGTASRGLGGRAKQKPSALRGSAAKWGRDDAFTSRLGLGKRAPRLALIASVRFRLFLALGRLSRFLPRTALPTAQPPAPERRSSPSSPRCLPDRADPV